jgi:hypothetical protein
MFIGASVAALLSGNCSMKDPGEDHGTSEPEKSSDAESAEEKVIKGEVTHLISEGDGLFYYGARIECEDEMVTLEAVGGTIEDIPRPLLLKKTSDGKYICIDPEGVTVVF